jgi:hypothetical protein
MGTQHPLVSTWNLVELTMLSSPLHLLPPQTLTSITSKAVSQLFFVGLSLSLGPYRCSLCIYPVHELHRCPANTCGGRSPGLGCGDLDLIPRPQ